MVLIQDPGLCLAPDIFLSYSSLQQSGELHVVFIPTLHMILLRPRKVKKVAQGHPAGQLHCFRFAGAPLGPEPRGVETLTAVCPPQDGTIREGAPLKAGGQAGNPGALVPSQGAGEVL